MGFDLVAQDEVGAGIAGAGGGELLAERGQCLGAAGRGERVKTVDGRLRINSPPGGPTVIAVELPSHA